MSLSVLACNPSGVAKSLGLDVTNASTNVFSFKQPLCIGTPDYHGQSHIDKGMNLIHVQSVPTYYICVCKRSNVKASQFAVKHGYCIIYSVCFLGMQIMHEWDGVYDKFCAIFCSEWPSILFKEKQKPFTGTVLLWTHVVEIVIDMNWIA